MTLPRAAPRAGTPVALAFAAGHALKAGSLETGGLAAAALIASRLTIPGAGVVDVSFTDAALR